MSNQHTGILWHVFLDEAEICVKSGDGGNGAATFRREKHVPRGGPDGGDGGKGGDVIMIADAHVNKLIEFRHRQKFEAGNGGDGSAATRHGKNGKDVVIKVPIGTVAHDARTGEILFDFVADGQRELIAKGGAGGKGNAQFANSVRQAPTFAQKGERGITKSLRLELKLLADIGLVGLPNAGKSTLISAISAAKPKIADYPFTTLEPNLGIVQLNDFSFVVADLPGIIQGASKGKGLGLQFLKHAERAQALVHVIECRPIDGSDPVANRDIIETELEAYSNELEARPSLIALSKIDLMPDARERAALIERLQKHNIKVLPISAVTGEGVSELVACMAEIARRTPQPQTVRVIRPRPIQTADERWQVQKTRDHYRVSGEAVERMVAMTDLENDEAVQYLHRGLERLGVIEALRREGAEHGDTVFIGDYEFSMVE